MEILPVSPVTNASCTPGWRRCLRACRQYRDFQELSTGAIRHPGVLPPRPWRWFSDLESACPFPYSSTAMPVRPAVTPLAPSEMKPCSRFAYGRSPRNGHSPRFRQGHPGLEQWLEDWLASDISVVDPGLMVIGRQVRTAFGGVIDLLCIEMNGDLVVVELKSGKTPREVTAQALDYSSWVKDLEFDEVVAIADRYLGGSGSFGAAFRERFETELPEQLNQGHRCLVVADSMDSSTVRIVRYLAGLGVPINVATVQHFRDSGGRELLAQVYLIEPEEVRPRVRGSSARSMYRTVNQLQALADENGIGEVYRRLRDGVRGIFSAQAYSQTVGYVRRLENGGVRTLCWSMRYQAMTTGE